MAAQFFIPVPGDNDEAVGPAYQNRFPVRAKQFYYSVNFIRIPNPHRMIPLIL
jgi:hypothetical protein